MSEPQLLAACRTALGYTQQGLAKFLAHREDRMLRRCEQGEQHVPTLLWLVLFYKLREDGKRELMNEVHRVIIQRRLATWPSK
jgi:hypothetical protein